MLLDLPGPWPDLPDPPPLGGGTVTLQQSRRAPHGRIVVLPAAAGAGSPDGPGSRTWTYTAEAQNDSPGPR